MNRNRTHLAPLKRIATVSAVSASLIFLAACEDRETVEATEEQDPQVFGMPDRDGADGADVNIDQPGLRVTVEQPESGENAEQGEIRIRVEEEEEK